jgi:fucose 4-O-acetylase-like acetyltransferase
MQLFFLLSGLFLFLSMKKPWRRFVSDKFRTIAYPYFVWSVITVLLKAALGDIPNHPVNFTYLPLIVYDPIDQFWFLYVLFVLSLAVSALLRLGLQPWGILVLAILVYPGTLPIASYGWLILLLASAYLIYLALGVMIGWDRDLQPITRIGVGSLAAAVVAGLMLSSLGGVSGRPNWYALDFVLAMSGIIGTVALAVLAGRAKLDAPIRFLGYYSLQIYVAHTIASAGVRIALQKVVGISALTPHIVLGTLAGLYLPIVLVLVFNRAGFRFGFALPRLNFKCRHL